MKAHQEIKINHVKRRCWKALLGLPPEAVNLKSLGKSSRKLIPCIVISSTPFQKGSKGRKRRTEEVFLKSSQAKGLKENFRTLLLKLPGRWGKTFYHIPAHWSSVRTTLVPPQGAISALSNHCWFSPIAELLIKPSIEMKRSPLSNRVAM